DYARARVMLGFQRFSGIGRERTGRPIVYALTVPSTAPHPVVAREFVDFVVAQSRSGGHGWPSPLAGA
ncbi:MAG: tungstate ABC transporter substrate-binding protein WtpA, partial [Methanoregulaceae archaeon]|nr:tungstate ABC transporter substrate-binding protein WtpA [Methanoregulaceae archaeon]